MNDNSRENILFEIETPLGFIIRTTITYWNFISTVKHPIMASKIEEVKNALMMPDEIRLSKNDPQVFLFYRSDGKKRWVCAVSRKLNGDGFLITAYRTSAIKEGVLIWHK